jgi:hypothetical protein
MNAVRRIVLVASFAVLAVRALAQPADGPPAAAEASRQAEVTTPGEAENPLQLIGEKMHESQAMIAAAKSGPLTQELQKDIVADLDQLIAQARKAGKPGGEKDSSKSTSRTPLGTAPPQPDAEGKSPGDKSAAKSDERNASTSGKQGDAARALDGMKKVWGTLPPREREKVLELKAEDFVPKYRAMIEEYYRRLAAGSGE